MWRDCTFSGAWATISAKPPPNRTRRRRALSFAHISKLRTRTLFAPRQSMSESSKFIKTRFGRALRPWCNWQGRQQPNKYMVRRRYMADKRVIQMRATLGLTGLTSNAMALIAPGAFLWLTFYIQANTGATAPTMWLGIVAALLLCLATAVAYAEISKLYPGTGSSYYYAEQALLSKDEFFKYARLVKFIVGWGSHLYYWVYPGVMVATTGMFVGYVIGFLYPKFLSGSNPGLVFMALVAIAFSFFVGWIAQKGRSEEHTSELQSPM